MKLFKPSSPLERLYNGMIKENPIFVLMLGMCPTLAVTTGGINGLISVFMAVFVIWCHRENIKRIQNRTESKLSFKKKAKDGEETK